jgi:hypothetical protein
MIIKLKKTDFKAIIKNLLFLNDGYTFVRVTTCYILFLSIHAKYVFESSCDYNLLFWNRLKVLGRFFLWALIYYQKR